MPSSVAATAGFHGAMKRSGTRKSLILEFMVDLLMLSLPMGLTPPNTGSANPLASIERLQLLGGLVGEKL
jgi:hypothetical protein